jgi:hypothetical protein
MLSPAKVRSAPVIQADRTWVLWTLAYESAGEFIYSAK